MIRVANPPCSWGVIENLTGETAGYRRVLDEMAETGYVGTELGHLPWTQLLGGDTILTIPPAWQRWLDASGHPVAARIHEPVDAAILDEMEERVPEFRLAHEPDGLAPGELESHGAFRRTLRQFLAAHADLLAEICDAILPKPDREKAGPEP